MSDHFEVDTDELVEQLGEHQRLTGTEPREESGGMSRRDLLLKGGAAAAAVSGVGALAGAASAAPATKGKYTGTLRVITLGVEWPTPEVQKKAEADLGVKFALTVTDPVTMVQKAITAPETFDVFGGYNYQDIQMWSSHHLMPVLLPSDVNRSDVMARMKNLGVQTSIHYRPIDTFSAYVAAGLGPSDRLPLTHDVGARMLTLPLYPSMGAEQIDYVCASLAEAVGRAARAA